MNYVSTVIGTLVIEDINLELHYMEIIDLSADDFKVSPRLREAHRVRQLVPYDPKVHRNAKRFNRFTSKVRLKNKPQPEISAKTEVKFSEASSIKQSLENLSDKLNGLVNRVNILITRQLDTNEKLNDNFDKFFQQKQNNAESEALSKFADKTFEQFKRMEEYWDKRFLEKDNKIDNLLSKLDEFMEKGIKVNGLNNYSYNGNGNGNRSYLSDSDFDDKVTFVPEINVSDIKTKVKSENIEQEGTDNILEALNKLKNKG